MPTLDITPTQEFLDAYRRVTGSDDTSPMAVITALRTVGVAEAIDAEHHKILTELPAAK